jgi:hypothetical protein
LFGSYAREEATDDSDVDVLFVVESDLPRPKRIAHAYRMMRSWQVAKDIVVYTPEEFDRWRGGWKVLCVIMSPAKGFVMSDARVLVKSWKQKSHHDLAARDQLLQAEDPLGDIIAFHAQQAVEKSLKGFLISRGCCDFPKNT